MIALAAKKKSLGETISDSVPKTPFQTDSKFFYGVRRQDPAHPKTPKLDHTYIDTNDAIDRVSRIISKGEYPPILIGETGTGKTECLRHIAHEMGIGMLRVNHNIRVEPEDIEGKWVMDGNTPVFARGPLTEALEEGLIYYADEFSSAKPGVLMAYQNVLERNGTVTLISGKGHVEVKRHPNFRFVAAMNPSVYSGSNEMSLATFNRFIAIQFDYPTAPQEKAILSSVFPSIKEETATLLVKFANAVRRRKAKDQNAMYVTSTRDLLKIAHVHLDLELDLNEAVSLVVLNAVKEIDETEFKAVRDLVVPSFPTTTAA